MGGKASSVLMQKQRHSRGNVRSMVTSWSKHMNTNTSKDDSEELAELHNEDELLQIPGSSDPKGKGSSPVWIRRKRLKEFQLDRPIITDQQMEVITKTWSTLQADLADVGCDMFTRMFATFPEVKGAFGPFRSLSPEDERYSRELRTHGLRVLGTVEAILTNWENPDAIVHYMHTLGRKHVTFSAKVDYMDIVGQLFLFVIEPVLKEEWSPEVEQAWADFFRYMTHLMKEVMIL